MPNYIDYDPEKPGTPLKYRLTFALCKARGIQIQPHYTPRDAWNALRGAGVSTRSEYEKMRDKDRELERARENRERNRRKREQLESAEHNPETHPGAEWDGYTVDIPDLDGIVGLPLVILTKDGESHISDPDEALDYLAYTRPSKTWRANEREFD